MSKPWPAPDRIRRRYTSHQRQPHGCRSAPIRLAGSAGGTLVEEPLCHTPPRSPGSRPSRGPRPCPRRSSRPVRYRSGCPDLRRAVRCPCGRTTAEPSSSGSSHPQPRIGSVQARSDRHARGPRGSRRLRPPAPRRTGTNRRRPPWRGVVRRRSSSDTSPRANAGEGRDAGEPGDRWGRCRTGRGSPARTGWPEMTRRPMRGSPVVGRSTVSTSSIRRSGGPDVKR